MKLNISLVRKILLECESTAFLTPSLSWEPIFLSTLESKLPNYNREDIAYTIILLEEAGLIDALISEADHGIYSIRIYRLTYSGHEFLDTIRSPQIFNKIQDSLSAVGTASLPIILELGKKYLLSALLN